MTPCTLLLKHYNPFLVQSALLGWLWGLPAAKELRRYGAMALWRYDTMALWRYGPMALRCKL